MKISRPWREVIMNDLNILILLALARILLHTLTNGQYGFHRDELAMLDDARYLAWGYVAYPPVTPLIARVALDLFGPSLIGVRFFSALAQSVAMVLTGLMARELDGSRSTQALVALAVAIAPLSLAQGALFQYVSFDYLWWVLIAYLMIRLLKSADPRWWLGIGATAGLGMMTKYTMAFYLAGIIAGVVCTKARRYLASSWLWGGVALSLLVFLPNLMWQIQHDFISLDHLRHIHARDVAIGRTDSYLSDQLKICANPFSIPLWIAGLFFYFVAPGGRRYRLLGWMFAVPFGLFLMAQGRGYYMAPAYPMLIAAGGVLGERWVALLTAGQARVVRGIAWGALAVGGAFGVGLTLPIAPVNSSWWQVASGMNNDLKEEIGWPELVKTVADIYTALPAEEKSQAGILAGNYGEAGAVNLYGLVYGLPEAISGMNSYWLRGYGHPPPQTLVVIGLSPSAAEHFFEACDLAGHVSNRYGVKNEETTKHPDILVCRQLRRPWPEFWKHFRYFG